MATKDDQEELKQETTTGQSKRKFIRDAPFESSATWEGVPEALVKCLRDTVKKNQWPILMYGPPGTGKTSAMVCLYRTLGKSPRWWNAVEFVRLVQRCRKDGHVLFEGSAYECGESSIWKTRVERPDLLFVDDIGLRAPTDSQYEIIYELINRRGDKPTIYTTNKSLTELGQMYDGRIKSRLGAGAIIEVKGQDRRTEGSAKKRVEI